MTNRREFLQTAAALSAAPLAGRTAFARDRSAAALAAVVIDTRFAPAREFGVRATQSGVPLRGIEGDITDLWRDELLPRWRAAPAAVAGLTERHALFLLERLAWDHNLRVVFEAEHLPDGHGQARHRVLRTADARLALALAAAGSDWPGTLADALITDNRAASRDFRPTGAAMAAYPGEPEKLYSWMIAPRAAA